MARARRRPWLLEWWPVVAFAVALLSSVLGAWYDMRLQIAQVRMEMKVTQDAVGALSSRIELLANERRR